MNNMTNKKGQLQMLIPMIVSLVVIGVVLVVGFLIFAQVRTQIVSIDNVDTTNASTYSAGFNATNTVTNAMATIPSWLPIIIIVVIGALLIGLVGFLGVGRRR